MAKATVQIENTIFLKPSTELIPDEYEHFDRNSKTLVHIFTDNECDKNVQIFFDTMIDIGYSIPKKNIHYLTKDDFEKSLKEIRDQAQNSTGLIILVSCESKKYGKINIQNDNECTIMTIQEICRKFDSQHCKALKNKPKIFIFQINMVSTVVTDAIVRRDVPFEIAYDTPVEADLLLIHNSTTLNQPSNFVREFCQNIKEYGQHEHIITLASCVQSTDSIPLVISTLTRKFYFSPSEARGHHLHIHKHHKDMAYLIDKLKNGLKTGRGQSSTRVDGRSSRAPTKNKSDAKKQPWRY